MKLGIPKEVHKGERRVAASPDAVQKLRKQGFDVYVESGAGDGARFTDDMYQGAGATIVDGAAALWSGTDLVMKVRPPEENLLLGKHESELLPEGGKLICLLFPGQNREIVDRLSRRNATVLALDCIPRISRAQKMDVLSSMANIAGYRAVIEATHHFGSFFGGQITAAGRTRPARVMVIGAGVAGLSAIAAARGLGAEVRAFDTRGSVKDQVKSLGATFLELDVREEGETAAGYSKEMSQAFIDAEMALFKKQCEEVDIVVTTALVPGKKAPLLITKEMVHGMRPGSVIVDLAAEQGGNCEVTVAEKTVEEHGVTVIGYTDLTSRLATHASQFFGNNIVALLEDMGGGEKFRIDLEDEAVRGAVVLLDGQLMWPPPARATAVVKHQPAPPPVEPPPDPELKSADEAAAEEAARRRGNLWRGVGSLAAAVALVLLGRVAPAQFLQHLTVFVLACFVGWQLIWNVTPALHTPLMSVTNAISGIILVGGILQAGAGEASIASVLGAVAILVASINVFGGFLVTQRMLKMFRK
jgi:NAD(P) transhydrogenase subunit alpha